METFNIITKQQPAGTIYIHMLPIDRSIVFTPTGIIIKTSRVNASLIKYITFNSALIIKNNPIQTFKSMNFLNVENGIEIKSGGTDGGDLYVHLQKLAYPFSDALVIKNSDINITFDLYFDVHDGLIVKSGGYIDDTLRTRDGKLLTTDDGQAIGAEAWLDEVRMIMIKRLEYNHELFIDSEVDTEKTMGFSPVNHGILINSGGNPFGNITTDDGEPLLTRDGKEIVYDDGDYDLLVHLEKRGYAYEDAIEITNSDIDTEIDKSVSFEDGIEIRTNTIDTFKSMHLLEVNPRILVRSGSPVMDGITENDSYLITHADTYPGGFEEGIEITNSNIDATFDLYINPEKDGILITSSTVFANMVKDLEISNDIEISGEVNARLEKTLEPEETALELDSNANVNMDMYTSFADGLLLDSSMSVTMFRKRKFSEAEEFPTNTFGEKQLQDLFYIEI